MKALFPPSDARRPQNGDLAQPKDLQPRFAVGKRDIIDHLVLWTMSESQTEYSQVPSLLRYSWARSTGRVGSDAK